MTKHLWSDILIVLIALLIGALIARPTLPDTNCGPVTYSDGTVSEECWEVTCQEDMPCWNCETMGNQICGIIIYESEVE